MFKPLMISAALVAGMGSAASAATITFSQSLADQTTNYTDRAVGGISQFDSSLGTLNSATVTLGGSVSGSISYESLDAAASTVSLTLSGEVGLSTSALGSLVVVLPTQTTDESVASHDGAIDFAGDSGDSITDLIATLSDSVVLTGGDLAEFIGTGFVDFLLSGTGLSNASGPGNLATIFQTAAGGRVSVTYDYTETPPAVPLPAGGVLLLSGLVGFTAMKRRGNKAV